MEKERLSRMGVNFISWQNRWIRGYLMAVPTVTLFFAAGGWVGMDLSSNNLGNLKL